VKLAQDSVSQLETRLTDLSLAGTAAASVIATAQQELADARARLAAAQAAFSSFRSQAGVGDLPGAISTQAALVNQLVVSAAGGSANTAALQAALATEEQELQRLSRLEGQYNDYAFQVAQAQGRIATLQQRLLDISVGQTLPPEAQIKVLDSARIPSSFWRTVLPYGLAVVLSLLVALCVVYLLAFFEREPITVERIRHELGVPVLARVPSAASDGRGT
jgi:capsule polysaccharide export protein KpsE/RkpR